MGHGPASRDSLAGAGVSRRRGCPLEWGDGVEHSTAGRLSRLGLAPGRGLRGGTVAAGTHPGGYSSLWRRRLGGRGEVPRGNSESVVSQEILLTNSKPALLRFLRDADSRVICLKSQRQET